LNNILPSDIRKIITAGRIGEARILLTTHGATFSAVDRSALEQELEQRQAEAATRMARAEDLEKAGHIDEAKAMYESVLLLAIDYPGVQVHINRLTESLSLTKAVRRRSQRRRVVTSPGLARTGKKKRIWPWFGAGLAGALTLLFLTRSPSPPPIATRPLPAAPVELTTTPPAGSTVLAENPEPPAQSQPAPSPPTPAPRQEEKTDTDRLAINEPISPPAIQAVPAGTAPPAPAQPAAPTGEPVVPLSGQPLAITNEPGKVTPRYRVRTGDSLISIAKQLFCDEGAC